MVNDASVPLRVLKLRALPVLNTKGAYMTLGLAMDSTLASFFLLGFFFFFFFFLIPARPAQSSGVFHRHHESKVFGKRG